MPEPNKNEIQSYLQSLLGAPVTVGRMTPLGGHRDSKDVKSYGYGVPVKIDFEANGEPCTAVLHTVAPGPFGHQHMADRAKELLWSHQAFNSLPRHVRSLDLCEIRPGGRLVSADSTEEFALLTDYVEGEPYARDLERIRDTGKHSGPDLARADALCDYLVDIHKQRGSDPSLYTRRVRELIGGNDCIMGIVDSYPPSALLQKVEQLCVTWRWRLKDMTQRLRQIHGDFHPWNILFRSGADFSVLDRSRGEFGDPADDVASLTMNYLFFSLQRSGRLEGSLETLFVRFWERYLEGSGDTEILAVAAPFFAFRGLVMASPVWYPALPDKVRQSILNFILAVLESDRFDPRQANEYCGV